MDNSKQSFRLSCPMPEFDFDVITMGHGSGGLLTHKFLESGVFNLFDNEFLQKKHDGAFLNLKGPVAFSSDSFVVSPIFFPGGNIGDLAVNGTVNDLAMCGAIPEYLSLSFLLEEGLKMEEFWEILLTIKNASDKAGVKIVTGDTKVVERGKGDKIFINTNGIGHIHSKANIDPSRVKKGDIIILSGLMALHGLTIMSLREGLEFESDLKSDTRALNGITNTLLDKFGDSIHLFRDPTRGGVATVLNEISVFSNLGIEIDEESLPLSPEVNGACEMLGLDPLYIANEGLFLSFVDPSVASEYLTLLKSINGAEKAAIIAEVKDAHTGQVLIKNSIGGRRVVQMLPGDQLPRIC
ncbi:MAG: hydrogenase expression/formation protein HypE [Cytophagales bacterium]